MIDKDELMIPPRIGTGLMTKNIPSEQLCGQ